MLRKLEILPITKVITFGFSQVYVSVELLEKEKVILGVVYTF